MESEKLLQMEQIKRISDLYRRKESADPFLEYKTVILVDDDDDDAATYVTIVGASKWIRKREKQ